MEDWASTGTINPRIFHLRERSSSPSYPRPSPPRTACTRLRTLRSYRELAHIPWCHSPSFSSDFPQSARVPVYSRIPLFLPMHQYFGRTLAYCHASRVTGTPWLLGCPDFRINPVTIFMYHLGTAIRPHNVAVQ